MKASDRYRVTGAECLVDGLRLPVANLSVGGLFAVTDRPPIAGQVLSLELDLPEHDPLYIGGLVTWSFPPRSRGNAASLAHACGRDAAAKSLLNSVDEFGADLVTEPPYDPALAAAAARVAGWASAPAWGQRVSGLVPGQFLAQ